MCRATFLVFILHLMKPIIQFVHFTKLIWLLGINKTTDMILILLPPGRHRETLQCWRPLGSAVTSQLRRFFIGGSPELEDPTYTAIPSTFQVGTIPHTRPYLPHSR